MDNKELESRLVDGPMLLHPGHGDSGKNHPTFSVVFISKNENIYACQTQGLPLSWINITIFCFYYTDFCSLQVDRYHHTLKK